MYDNNHHRKRKKKKKKPQNTSNLQLTIMVPTQPNDLSLQTMPVNMLSLILSKVGATSSIDYYNTILTCKDKATIPSTTPAQHT